MRDSKGSGGKHVLVIAGIARSLTNFRGPLLEAMVASGHRVTACAPDENPTVRAALDAIGVRFRRVGLARAGLNPLLDLRTLGNLYQTIVETNPDVLLAYTIKPVIYGSLAGRWAGVRDRHALITGLGYAFGKRDIRRRLLGRAAVELYRASLAGSRTVFFQNPDDLELFRRLRIVDDEQAVLVNGSGVDLAHFEPVPIAAQVPSFLLIARLIEEKGVLDYVAAAREIKKRYPQATFRLAGALDSNPNSIRPEMLASWQREGLIEYLGRLDDVRPALAACSVYVLPSFYREGTPRSVLEAMATGRPIITTDAPGCRETTIDGQNGFLVPPRDVGALVEAMARFIESPALATSMGSRSLEVVREKYDVHAVNRVMLEAMGLSTARLEVRTFDAAMEATARI